MTTIYPDRTAPTLPAGATCQEVDGATAGGDLIRCGAPANCIVDFAARGHDEIYFMCGAHGTHAVVNRGGSFLSFRVDADDLALVEDDTPHTDADLLALVDDPAPASTGLLHDVVEDTLTTIERVTELFAASVADVLAQAGNGGYDLMPAEFVLPPLVRFVPNRALREALEQAVAVAAGIDVTAPAGLEAADAALGNVRDAMKAIEAHFEEPKRLAHDEHKRITGTLADWLRAGERVVGDVGGAMLREHERRDAAARDQARQAQAVLDREAQDRAREEAQYAAAAGAPADVVADLEQQADTARAITVAPVAAPTPLARNAVAKAWKARLVGTLPGDEINPKSDELTPAQVPAFEALLRAVLEGRASRAVLSVNWTYANKRASGDKTAMQIPGLEAVRVAGLKGKASR